MRIKVSGIVNSKRSKSLKKTLFTIFVFSVVIFFFYALFERIYPNYISRAEIFAHNTSQKIINQSLEKILEKKDYETFINISTDENGKIMSIEADTNKMNMFRTEITADIQKRTEKLGESYLSIPLGSLLKNEIFSGLGPSFKIKILPEGFIESDFKDEFVSCGINHIKHKTNLEITLSFTLIGSAMKKTTKVVKSVPVCETIISGDVPYYYGNGILPAS